MEKNNKQNLFDEISSLIEQSRRAIYTQVSNTTILLFWEIGQCINRDIPSNKRADYGKQVVMILSEQLTEKYGRSFDLRNLRRMMQFAEQFPNFQMVSALPTPLTWSHFIEILPIKTYEGKLFYLKAEFEQKIHTILTEVRNRLERRNLLSQEKN